MAKTALESLIGPHAEFLHLTSVRSVHLYAVNVLTLVDCLDAERSQIVYSPDHPGRIVNVLSFSFKPQCVPDVPIFKLTVYPNDVFVTERFIDAVRNHGLTGAAFGDPGVNPLPLLMRGKSVNTR